LKWVGDKKIQNQINVRVILVAVLALAPTLPNPVVGLKVALTLLANSENA